MIRKTRACYLSGLSCNVENDENEDVLSGSSCTRRVEEVEGLDQGQGQGLGAQGGAETLAPGFKENTYMKMWNT